MFHFLLKNWESALFLFKNYGKILWERLWNLSFLQIKDIGKLSFIDTVFSMY